MNIVKTSVLAVLFACLFTAATVAQTNADAQTAGEAQECFAIEGTTDYFFGEIDPDETVEHTFVFKNKCSETIEVSQARASCGCTAAVLSEKVIPPGGEAKIHVKFTPPRGTRGKATKTVSVYLKDQDKPHTVIRFSANIKTDIEIHPPYVQFLGAEVGKGMSGSVSIKNVSADPMEIESISINMTTYADTSGTGRTIALPLDGAIVAPHNMTLKPGESGDVTVTLTPTFKGQVNGAVRLKTKKNESVIQVFGVVREAQPTDLRRAEGKSESVLLDSK
jgi:uncharacterized cupredoxin-like copper-binding protein